MSSETDFKTFGEFLDFHKEECLQLDLEKLENRVYTILQEQRDKFHHATFEGEKEEVREFCIEAIKSTKADLLKVYRDKRKATYLNVAGRFKIAINLYFQYSELYQETIEPEEKVNSEINLYPDIFTNKIGYSIFERINKKFISQKETHLANYSFLFYALQKDNFLLCTPTEFKNFLSDNFQIELDKIDTRQSGKSKKTILYEAIKEQITGIAQ